MRTLLLHAVTDDKGNVSHARIIALLVGFSASIFMWKLIVTGDMTPDYFLYYLSYGVIHMNVSKGLDVLNNFFGRRGDGTSISAGRGADRAQADNGRGRPDVAAREDLRALDDGAGRKTEDLG